MSKLIDRKRLLDAACWLATFIIAAAVIFSLSFLRTGKAFGQELGDYGLGHQTFSDFYEKGERGGPLMRPHQPAVKCCDGDCRPVKARYVSGNWHVYVDRIWVIVPADRIKIGIPPPETPFRSAHVCAAKYNGKDKPEIYCFIPVDADG